MNKADRLKKKVIVTGIICAVAIGLCLGLVLFVSSFSEESEMRLMRLRAQRATIESNNAAAIERSKTVKQTIETYQRINPQDNRLYGTLDRKQATIVLDQLNQQYQLKNLNLNITPAINRDASILRLKTGGISSSTVTISFGSLTDEYAFSFFRDIIASFPGFMHITSVNLVKNSSIDSRIYYDAVSGEIPALVKGEFVFEWLGLELQNKKENAEQAPVN